MTDLRADSMTGEQWVLEERTADPTSTEEGGRWLRADLNSGDKIATLRVDVGTSILDVPVFSAGSAVDVSEAMRVQVNGTIGYVPLAPVSDATYPELRMQHSGATYGFHDAVEISAIPDSVVFYDLREMDYSNGETVTTLFDSNENINSSAATGSPTYQDGFVLYDGVDDGHHITQASESDPYPLGDTGLGEFTISMRVRTEDSTPPEATALLTRNYPGTGGTCYTFRYDPDLREAFEGTASTIELSPDTIHDITFRVDEGNSYDIIVDDFSESETLSIGSFGWDTDQDVSLGVSDTRDSGFSEFGLQYLHFADGLLTDDEVGGLHGS